MKYFKIFNTSSLSAKLPLYKLYLPKSFYIVVVSFISVTNGTQRIILYLISVQ